MARALHRSQLALPARLTPSNRPAATARFGWNYLRLPDATFDPAQVDSNYDWALSASGADQLWFRAYHWWSYSRMRMQGGYFEGAIGGVDTGQTDDNGDPVLTPIYFRYQASGFKTARLANAAYSDGVSRVSTYGPKTSCTKTLHVPCTIFTADGTVNDGSSFTDMYVVIRVNNCTSETSASTDPDTYDAALNDIVSVHAAMDVVAVQALKSWCKTKK